MSNNAPNRSENNVPEHLIQEFLERGGTVQQCPAGARSTEISVGYWGNKRRRPKQQPDPVE